MKKTKEIYFRVPVDAVIQEILNDKNTVYPVHVFVKAIDSKNHISEAVYEYTKKELSHMTHMYQDQDVLMVRRKNGTTYLDIGKGVSFVPTSKIINDPILKIYFDIAMDKESKTPSVFKLNSEEASAYYSIAINIAN